jgi:chemotaxis protein MotB
MARRKRQLEERSNHEAWAIPYADLLTLILAFFVVMYAISSINEGKYRVLSDSLVAAFRAPPKAPEPVQVGDVGRPAADGRLDLPRNISPLELGTPFTLDAGVVDRGPGDLLRDIDLELDEIETAAEGMSRIADEIERAVSPLIDADLIRMRRDRFWIEVEINTSLLFASGSAQLSAEAAPVLEELAGILRDFPARIRVEGFTDTVPISTPVFPSNWELSAARAASVVHLFSRNDVDPTRMAAIGYGEFRPVASNDTPEGRRQNRRVTIVVLADGDMRMEEATRPEALREDMERRAGQAEEAS